MSENGRRYIFSGHAIGVAAQFHRLGEMTGLNHVVPALGAAVLPVTGGLSRSEISEYDYPVMEPFKRSLVSVKHVESKAQGLQTTDGYCTEVNAKVEGLHIVEKLHIDLVELHMSSTKKETGPSSITTTGNKIEGMRLGNVAVTVTLDDETLANCGTKEQLAEFYARQDNDFRRKNSWRFFTEPEAAAIREHGGHFRCSLVREISLNGPSDEIANIHVHGNKIVWPGFGKIYLGEVQVSGKDRRMTMVRLDMGSDAGGSGTVGDAGTNGSVST